MFSTTFLDYFSQLGFHDTFLLMFYGSFFVIVFFDLSKFVSRNIFIRSLERG